MSDFSEITQLILRERQGRDRGWWAQMARCYHDDSLVELSWFRGTGPEFVAQSEAMTVRPVHRLSPPVIHLNDDRAVVETPAAIELRYPIGGVAVDGVSYTRLLHRVRRGEDGWRIDRATCIYERDTAVPAIPGTVPDIDRNILDQFRKPYRFLAYQLSLIGHEAGDDLYGDDEPERVAELYTAAFDWLATR